MTKHLPGRIVTVEGGQPSGDPLASSRAGLLGAMEAIARIATEAESVPAGLAGALGTLCGALGWPIGHVYQRAQADSPLLVSSEVWHLAEPQHFAAFQELTRRISFRPGQGLVGQVLAQRRPGLSADVANDRRFLRRRAAQAEGVHAWLAFPVIADGQVIAVCELFSSERVSFDHSLTGMLACAGCALGRLYERERWRAERDNLCQQLDAARHGLAEERMALRGLAGEIAHELNSPLFSARASLALLDAGASDEPLLASAEADLARVAAVIERLQALAQGRPPHQTDQATQ
jgi:signal transduction histidine kinase